MSVPISKLPDDRLVIALDFGTTYSGVAYAFNVPGKKADITSIQDWPGLEGYRQPKVPTLIMYDENDPTKFKWGGQVDWRDPAVRGVKLMLDPDQERPIYVPAYSLKKDPKAKSKAPVDIAGDFIGAIYEHALSVIQSRGLQEYFDLCQKDFILSVPAAWSDKAKDLTLQASTTFGQLIRDSALADLTLPRQAAKKAGIHPVTLIKEPEAAALYTLTTHEHAIMAGDAFVLCDAGGGTVDLITYEIKKIEPFLQLIELVPGKGGMAGSLGLNQRFEESVRDVVGEDQFCSLKKTVGWAKALNEFDKNIKTAFNGDSTETHYVTFPKAGLQDDSEEGVNENCWEMKGVVLKRIFEPIIQHILQLVDDQVTSVRNKRGGQGPKAIFLVGGFGSSRYLRERLQQVYKPQNIQVVQPHDAWGAIVNGAVLSRVSDQATVVSTQAVRHYGICLWQLYSPQRDQGRPIRFFPDEGKYRVQRLSWFIYMGEDLKRDQTVKFHVSKTLNKNYTPSDLIFHNDLCFSEAALAPDYPGPNVKPCATVRSDLRSISKRNMAKRTGADGKIYYYVDFSLVLCTAHVNLKFSVELDGMEMGSADAAYI